MKIVLDRWCFTDLDVKITELSSLDVYLTVCYIDDGFDRMMDSIPEIIVNQIRCMI